MREDNGAGDDCCGVGGGDTGDDGSVMMMINGTDVSGDVEDGNIRYVIDTKGVDGGGEFR